MPGLNKTEIIPISALIPDSQNANLGSERGGKLLMESIQKYKLGRSIVTDRNGIILAGNKTHAAAEKLGIDKIRVVETDGSELVVVKRMDLKHGSAEATGLALSDNVTAKEGILFDLTQVATLHKEHPEVVDFWFPDLDSQGKKPPDEFPSYDEDIETEHTCPSCGYSWSGQSS